MEKRRKSASLLPVGVFLVFYLGLGILFEYIMKIPMGFYNVPIVVAFLAALLVACLQNRKVGFDEKLEIMGRGIGDKNIITMLLIFLTAGTFVGVVGRSSAAELFGFNGMPFYCIVVAVSYLLSGYYSLYKEQKIVYSKTENKYVDKHTK